MVLWALLLFYCSQILKLSGKNHLLLLGYGVMDLVFVITSTILFRMENAGILSIVLGSVIGMAAGAVCLCVILCLQVAGEIYKSTPLGQMYDRLVNEQLGSNFAISKSRDVSIFSSPEKFYHSGDVTQWCPLNVSDGVQAF